jgi:hypothetical protein
MDWGPLQAQAHPSETDRQTLVVRHTIATNAALRQAQVPEAVRQFLLEVWTQALAETELQHGPHSPALLALRQTAQHLVDIARLRRKHDRKLRYHADQSTLLPRLMDGMDLLHLDARDKAHHLQTLQLGMEEDTPSWVNGNLTDAWSAAVLLLARREPLVDERNLHSHRQLNDLALQVMAHHDQLRLHTVTHGGADPTPDTLRRVQTLQLGERFWRQRNPLSRSPVQLEWLGNDGQLCLLCDDFHTGYLYHRIRLAYHLQAGLLRPLSPHTPMPAGSSAAESAHAARFPR